MGDQHRADRVDERRDKREDRRDDREQNRDDRHDKLQHDEAAPIETTYSEGGDDPSSSVDRP